MLPFYGMLVLYVLQALVVGIVVSAPVGPVGAMVIRRTLRYGVWYGVFTGIGAAFADTLFGTLAFLGTNSISDLFVRYQLLLSIVGGLIMLVLGVFYFIRARQNRVEAAVKVDLGRGGRSWKLFRSSLTAFLVTITNVMTIMGFGVIFSQLNFHQVGDTLWKQIAIVISIFLGCMMWWLTLTGMTKRLGQRSSRVWLKRIEVGIAILVILSGILFLARSVKYLNNM